jgi:hypothetical protein
MGAVGEVNMGNKGMEVMDAPNQRPSGDSSVSVVVATSVKNVAGAGCLTHFNEVQVGIHSSAPAYSSETVGRLSSGITS